MTSGLAAWLASVVLAAAPSSVPPTPAPAPDMAALRAEATRLFRAKKYEAACPKFEATARLAPDDLDSLTDLALCEHRLGHVERARELNTKVIAAASSPASRRGDQAYARHRRHAYFNLDRLDKGGLREGGSAKDREQDCAPLPAIPGCGKRLHACTVSKGEGWAARLLNTTHVRLAPSAQAARFSADDIVDLQEPELGRLEKEADPTPVPVAAGQSMQYVESSQEETRGNSCDDKEWSCDGSQAVAAAAKACVAAARKAGKEPPGGDAGCAARACADAEARPSAAVRREQKAIAREAAQCNKDAPVFDGEYGCNLVHADPCTGLVGLVCTGRAGGQKRTRTRVEEYLFEEVR